MEGRRYPEGGTAPALEFPDRQSTYTPTEALRKKRRTKYIVPKAAQLSGTSTARDCYVDRHFSQKLQQMMLNYSYTLVKTQVLSGEI